MLNEDLLIEVPIGPRNKTYYENLGYDIPKYYDSIHCKWVVKRGTKIFVKQKDIPKNSNVKITVKCDNCGKENNNITYQNYLIAINNGCDNNYYCHKCANAIYHSKEKHWNWNFNLTQAERESRSREYFCKENNEFKKKVRERDKYICQLCGKKNNIIVHHLNSYNTDIENRFNIENGIVLCEECHKNFHKKYGYGNNTKEQFYEYSRICEEASVFSDLK